MQQARLTKMPAKKFTKTQVMYISITASTEKTSESFNKIMKKDLELFQVFFCKTIYIEKLEISA
ncbi:hypothetical protein CHRYSEO8AT_300068 [Chryseobacterium sp. 8AT]|nr:hypothetical protein CHRYSEO8AT_300068 [Chryseobacterium sp. 8AT]